MQTTNEEPTTVASAIERFTRFLKMGYYYDNTINQRSDDCSRIAMFAKENGYEVYNDEMCRAFCDDLTAGRNQSDLSRRELSRYRTAQLLLEYVNTGTFTEVLRKKRALPIAGVLAETSAKFFEANKPKNWVKSTLNHYVGELRRFSDYLNRSGIVSINEITAKTIQDYFIYCGPIGKEIAKHASTALRAYLSFLHVSGELSIDLTQAIPKINCHRQPLLPSLYSDEEVQCVLNSIDRGNPVGKRDYAMIALSAYLGLRASDVIALKFNEIDWAYDMIRLVQKKTGKLAELPLLPLVGNAILDYIQYGRPKSDSDYVFLSHINNFSNLSGVSFSNTVTRCMREAGINTENRHHGPHALRHSLAARLLAGNTPLHVISEALVHKSIETTEYYIRIDTDNLRRCALDVPPTNFYTQNKGWLI